MDTHVPTNTDNLPLDFDVDAELAKFEAEERARLGLEADDVPEQWKDDVPQTFTASQREHTTLLMAGLTVAHDTFTESMLRGIGYKVKALDVPDNDALRFGKEFGNRGQCNPTYFTVGNLVKYLTYLRDEQGISTEDIVNNYLFITAGACGPCRFGTYVTEYRKALRDSGFDGFRVLLFQQTGGLKQATGEELGFKADIAFTTGFLRALLIGDILNAIGYRIRPYEVEAGATDAALDRCKEYVCGAFESGNHLGMLPALYKCRQELAKIEVDKLLVKPKVSIIGEFWAMTTEGDGNYGLQRFLEQEGAEADIQLVTAWILYMVWQGKWDTEQRADLRGTDTNKRGLEGVDVGKKLLMMRAADKGLRGIFQTVANGLGLYDYHLPDMDELADVSAAFYDNHLRGGEGHMEVGKLILNTAKQKVNMTLSVKPFGCMPSSSVSDGVQSLITEMYPEGIFLPIETSGDGAVNVYSRVQMQLFKAKQAAQKEFDRALEKTGLSEDDVRAYLDAHPRMKRATYKAPHVVGCSAADMVYDVAAKMESRKQPLRSLGRKLRGALASKKGSSVSDAVRAARAAAAKMASPIEEGSAKDNTKGKKKLKVVA